MVHANNPEQPVIPSDLVRDDPALEEVVLKFVAGLGARLQSMERAVRGADFDALCIAAHQLKGSGGGHGYPVLTERAAALERHAKDRALDECMDVLVELKQLCARIVVRNGTTPP